MPDAAFTPKHIVQLEIYATRHQDPLERLRVETIVHRAETALQSESKLTTQPQHEMQILPGEHLRHADQQIHQASSNHNQTATRTDGFLPEKDRPSTSHLPRPEQVQLTNAQPAPADPTKETPDLDITL
jgi:hypothetical protein